MANAQGQTITDQTTSSQLTISDVLKVVAWGGLSLGPMIPPLALCGALAGIASAMMPQSKSYSKSKGETSSQTITDGTTVSKSESESIGTTMAQEYINVHLQAIESQLKRHVERIDGRVIWDVGTYLMTEFEEDGADATAQLAALLNGARADGEEPIRFQDLSPFWKEKVHKDLTACRKPRFEVVAGGTGERVTHPLGDAYGGLSTPLNSEELSLLVSFPRREVVGIRARPYAAFALNPTESEGPSFELGEILRSDDPVGVTLKLPMKSLTKNALVTGSTGSGKSVTCRSILKQLLESGTPFLVIEPAKNEYVEWACRINASLPADSPNRIRIFKPGAVPATLGDDHCELRLNPFHVVSQDQVISHIERLKALLTMAFPMQESLPLLLEGLIYSLYARNGWLNDRSKQIAMSPRTPTLANLLVARVEECNPRSPKRLPMSSRKTSPRFLDDFVHSKGYEDRVAKNFIGALRTRFESLRVGWKSKVFDTSVPPRLDELFGKPTVVNLSLIGDEFSRSLAIGLLMSFLHEWRQFQQETGFNDGVDKLRHLMVLEEAHCILEPVRHVSAESMDPKGMVSRMFADLLSEMRAWGQGFMIVDQYPTRLILDAIKNTNLKIIHRLPSRDDQDVVAAAMSLDTSQAKLIPHLVPGQAIAMGDRDDAPFRILINPRESM